MIPPIQVVLRECTPSAGEGVGHFVIVVPAEIERSCPSVAPLIAAFVQQVAKEAPIRESGSPDDPLFRAVRVLFVGIFLVGLGLAIRGARDIRSVDARLLALGIASFAAALAVRAALPFSLGNWYSEVMPAAGPPPWPRFGPGFFAFQSLLRDAGIWSQQTLVVSQLLIGAAALPLLLAVLRELQIGMNAAAAALVLLVFAPFHARLSATSSEHVLASTLCLGLLLAWLRAARSGDRLWFGLTLLLFPVVCATRVDMAVQASLVLLWPLLRDRSEAGTGPRTRSLWGRAAVLAAMAALTLVTTYRLIALPSHHPMPEWEGQLLALRHFIPQFWILATREPAWMSLSTVVLAIPGLLAMAVQRPLMLLRVAVTLLLAFVISGRLFLPDELLAARYFLFTIPIFLVVSGLGFEALLHLAPRRYRTVTAAIGIVVLGAWTAVAAQTAYATRYAFQDEYTFARAALAQLPAGCTVYQVPLRVDVLPRDLDCCLDIPRSPLRLEFPQLRFLYLPDDLATVFSESGCVAYYESIACEIADAADDASVHGVAEPAAAYFGKLCAQARRSGRLEAIAESTTSAHATVSFFRDKRPHVGLYRWSP